MSVVWKMRLSMFCLLLLINLLGAAMVFSLAAFVVPLPAGDNAINVMRNLVLLAFLMPVFVVVGVGKGWVILQPTGRWLREQRKPTHDEQRWLLATPRRMFLMHASLWMVGVLSFGLFNSRRSWELGWAIALIVFLAGLTTASVAYLVSERILRPLARRALRHGVPDRLRVRSVAMRTMFAWVLGTGVAVLGIMIVGLRTLTDQDRTSVPELAITMLVLGALAFGIGGFTTYLAARASSDPVRALRQALARVGRGDLDAEVQIYDGTEIGMLQVGFNEMVAGLRERERMQDLFGRHVGADVARAALEGGVHLGGEAREVAVLFVDIIGSTAIAAQRPPEEVVALLNRFFDVVIDVVHEHDGWINKFQGDAALAVWGAPMEVSDMAAQVLRAARTLGGRLHREVPELAAGIGVSYGTAVAGNVGASERYEYTVIGDPVNEAARLTELAKDVPGHVVAEAGLLEACAEEGAYWTELDPVVVRGRTEPTRVATPLRT